MASDNSAITVLVTGGSGFLGSWVVHDLLLRGYTVRTTVRSLSREAAVRDLVLPKSDPTAPGRLSVYAAELMSDKGWQAAVQGCDYVQHVASPFPSSVPKDEDEVIKPAVEGTLRVLRACADAGVKRVVLTSSYAAIGYGHTTYSLDHPLSETDWSDPTSARIAAYQKSKTLAERAAWDFVATHPLELTVINPAGVFGPVLGVEGGRALGTSMSIIQKLLSGSLPAAPAISFGIVDVRDVSTLQILAMTNPKCKGERYLAVANDGKFVLLQDVAKACGTSIRTLPTWLTSVLAVFVPDLKMTQNEIGKQRTSTNKKARETFGIDFRPWEQSIKDSKESLQEFGIVKK